MLKYIIANIIIRDIPDSIDRTEMSRYIDKFLGRAIQLIDFMIDEENHQIVLTILSSKSQIMGLIQKILRAGYFSPKTAKEKKRMPSLFSISFYPLRMEKIDELNQFVLEHLPQISKSIGKGIVPLGYLTTGNNPPFLAYYSKMDDADFRKKLKKSSEFIMTGREFVQGKNDVAFISTKPYPVVFYLKIALNDIEVVDKICEKLRKFGKVNYAKNNRKHLVQEYSLVTTAHTYSVPNDTATIAVKINDYRKIPVHKVMIYIYDILEKNDCIPFDAEFAFPIPSEVIKIASEDLFYDKESRAELLKEIEEVLTLFRFDIDNIFGYPSMLLEKKYNMMDIV